MRKLASIQKVISVTPIEGADRIELAHVLGWQCVVNKGSFKPGDLGVYFEIDSFLPIKPEFEFLRSSSYKKSDIIGEGFRLKTQKFRGQISQGLLLPLSNLNLSNVQVGDDVTEILGVRKWEIAERVSADGTIIGTLPDCIPFTDETRIQAQPDLLNEFKGLKYYISTKMDGSSHSICIDSEKAFHVTGHQYEYKDDSHSSFYELVKARDYYNKMKEFMEKESIDTMTIQGEFCGAGIQKNRLKLKNPEWYVFTIKINNKRVGLDRMLEICKTLNMTSVPIEEVDIDLPAKYPTIESLLERASGNYTSGNRKEGIVIRPVEPVYSQTICAPLSIKVINNNYLLKESD